MVDRKCVADRGGEIKWNFLTGKSSTHEINDTTRLDVSVFPRRWTTLVNMDTWEEGNSSSLKCSSKNYINFDKFLPMKIAEKIAVYLINKQSRKVAGIDLI